MNISQAKEIVEKEKGKMISCAIMPNYYVFCKKDTEYYYVSNDGKVFPFSPSLDLINYVKAKKIDFRESNSK